MGKLFLKALYIVLCAGLLTVGCTKGNNNDAQSSGKSSTPATESKGSETNSTSPDAPAAPKPVTLKVWIDGGYTTYLNRWGKDEVSKYIQEKTGITLDIMTGDGSNDSTKLNLMISSNDLPDLVIVPKNADAIKLQSEGLVENLDELVKQCAECGNLKKLFAETNDINLKFNRFKDGNYWGGPDAPLYGLSDYFVDKHTYDTERLNVIQERNTWMARYDIYEKEGKPDLSNMDDFYNYLKNIKKYKDVNGNPVTPLGLLNNGDVINVFVGSFTGNIYPLVFEGSSVKNLFETPAYKDALLFLNKLYREKLLDQEMFTETYDQWKEKRDAGNIGLVPVWYWHTGPADAVLKEKDPSMFYQSIPGEFAPKAAGVNKLILNSGWAIGLSFGWRTNFIPVSTSDEKKQAAIRFLDFMYGHEGQMLQWFGLPGKYYAPAEAWDPANLPKLQDKSMGVEETAEWKAFKEAKGNDANSESGVAWWNFWNIQGYGNFVKTTELDDNDPVIIRYKINREQVLKLSEYDLELAKKNDVLTLTANSDPGMLAINNAVVQIQTKSMPKIIMASSDTAAGKAYDDMIAEMKTAGLDKLNAAMSQTYADKMLPLLK